MIDPAEDFVYVFLSNQFIQRQTTKLLCTYKIMEVFYQAIENEIGIVCYPTYGGSGIVAAELGKALADKGHEVHFISYSQPVRLDVFGKYVSP